MGIVVQFQSRVPRFKQAMDEFKHKFEFNNKSLHTKNYFE